MVFRKLINHLCILTFCLDVPYVGVCFRESCCLDLRWRKDYFAYMCVCIGCLFTGSLNSQKILV